MRGFIIVGAGRAINDVQHNATAAAYRGAVQRR